MGDIFGETILEVGTAESRKGGSGQWSGGKEGDHGFREGHEWEG